jgi:hypothetical protein
LDPKLHAMWSQAHADLPALVQSLQPQLGDIAKSVLGFVGGIGVGLLQFLAAFIIAGIIMAFGEAGDRANLAIFQRVLGKARGAEFANSPRRPFAPLPRASSVSRSSRPSSSACACWLPAFPGRACWRSSCWCSALPRSPR